MIVIEKPKIAPNDNIILEQDEERVFEFYNIRYKEVLKYLRDKFAPDIYFLFWRGALNDEDYEVKLSFKEYYRNHFLFQTLRNLARIKINNKIFRLIKVPKKDMKKHVHYKNPDLYPLLLQGRRIYDAWKDSPSEY